MRLIPAATASAVWFVLAPGVVCGLVPWSITRWHGHAPGLPLQLIGAALITAGTLVLVRAFVQFVRDGRGSPAPVAAPDLLVVNGLYRYVRNPMYVAVVLVITGQVLLFARLDLLWWVAVVAAASAAFVHGFEEPDLRERFGARYDEYRRAVPAWLPRMRPWQPQSASTLGVDREPRNT